MQPDNFNPYQSELHSKIEHDRMIMNLKSVLGTSQGREVFKYLFKHFLVGEGPPLAGVPSELRDDILGYMRGGSSIFAISAQADNFITANILAEIQKEKYDVSKKE